MRQVLGQFICLLPNNSLSYNISSSAWFDNPFYKCETFLYPGLKLALPGVSTKVQYEKPIQVKYGYPFVDIMFGYIAHWHILDSLKFFYTLLSPKPH